MDDDFMEDDDVDEDDDFIDGYDIPDPFCPLPDVLDHAEEEGEDRPLQTVARRPEVSSLPDADGLLRVGPQPRARYPWIAGMAPQVNRRREVRILENFDKTDRWIPGANHALVGRNKAGILSEYRSSMATIGNPEDQIAFRRCDYTGLPVSGLSGPLSLSMEAVYLAFVSDGSVQYHAPPNIAFIMLALNLVKRQFPPLCLPLMGQWMRTLDAQGVDGYQQLEWVYNATINIGILTKVFSTFTTHAVRAEMWGGWPATKQRAVLECLRTGVLCPETRPEVEAFAGLEMPRGFSAEGGLEYGLLLRIANKYGMTEDEFRFYSTIPAPEGGSPVFYPFHVLSRPQAVVRGWDWRHTLGFAKGRLDRMRACCNADAENAALGEPRMDAIKVVYWMAHHWCDKIKSVQATLPDASREDIRFRLLDRWGLPVVPWINNLFCASLCKKQDHGIAMKFGFAFNNDDAFDPVDHLDLGQCTITVDAVGTNMGMWNYSRES